MPDVVLGYVVYAKRIGKKGARRELSRVYTSRSAAEEFAKLSQKRYPGCYVSVKRGAESV